MGEPPSPLGPGPAPRTQPAGWGLAWQMPQGVSGEASGQSRVLTPTPPTMQASLLCVAWGDGRRVASTKVA